MTAFDPEVFDPGVMTPTSTTVLWEGDSSDLTHLASKGRVTAERYKITEDAIQFASGILSNREDKVPLWAVLDVDIRQTITQKARGVADLPLKIDPRAPGAHGKTELVLKSIRDGKTVRELIMHQSNTVRNHWNQWRQGQEIERRRAGAYQMVAPSQPQVAQAASGPGDDLMAQLSKLGEMKQAGLLSEEEFAAAKARLLGTSG
jgi:hypothetical protein